MLQRIAVPVRPGKTDRARRPRGNALLGVVWSFTEVVSLARRGRPQSSLAGERHRLLRGSGSGCTPSAGEGGGGL